MPSVLSFRCESNAGHCTTTSGRERTVLVLLFQLAQYPKKTDKSRSNITSCVCRSNVCYLPPAHTRQFYRTQSRHSAAEREAPLLGAWRDDTVALRNSTRAFLPFAASSVTPATTSTCSASATNRAAAAVAWSSSHSSSSSSWSESRRSTTCRSLSCRECSRRRGYPNSFRCLGAAVLKLLWARLESDFGEHLATRDSGSVCWHE